MIIGTVDLLTCQPAREDLARRIEDIVEEMTLIHKELQSKSVASGSCQMYVETQLARSIEIVGSCVKRLRR